jgi:hypothetical protein
LSQAGATRGLARSRLTTGRWWRPFRGVYADARVPREPATYARAALLLVPHGLVSHGTAMQLWGITVAEAVRTQAELTIDRDAPAALARPGLLVHRAAIAHAERRCLHGIHVLDPGRTVIDIARCQPPQIGLAVADAVLRAGLTNPAELQAKITAAAGLRGAVKARRVVSLADRRSESPMESITR